MLEAEGYTLNKRAPGGPDGMRRSSMALMGLLIAVGMNFVQLWWGNHWRPWVLGLSALLYVGFTLYVSGS